MNDQRSFRALIPKLQNRLSSNTRRDRPLLLDEIGQERISDHLEIDNIPSLLESLFDQGKINNNDFNSFIEAFREIGFDDTVKRLSAYQQKKQRITQLELSNESMINNEESKVTLTDNLKNEQSMETSNHHPLQSFDSTLLINEPHTKSRKSILKRWSRYRLFFLIFNILGVLSVLILLLFLLIDKRSKQVKFLSPEHSGDGICATATWLQNGITVAGGNGVGSKLNQLSHPNGLFLDANQSIYVADSENNRIVKWDPNASTGQLAAGGNGRGNSSNQLNNPHDIVVDDDGIIYISDTGNERVQVWYPSEQNGYTVVHGIRAKGIARNEHLVFYVADAESNQVFKWHPGRLLGGIVSKLGSPFMLFVDRKQSIYVADYEHNEIIKKDEGKHQVSIISSEYHGDGIEQLNKPTSVIADHSGAVYIADSYNHRITRWLSGASVGSIIVGGHGQGSQPNQLSYPADLSFDQEGNLYVSDSMNHRIQKFIIDKSSC